MQRRSFFNAIFGGSVAASTVTAATENTIHTPEQKMMEMAHDIAKAEAIQHFYYIDCGNMPKVMAERYVQNIRDKTVGKRPDLAGHCTFLARREDRGGGTKVEMLHKPYTLARVMEIYRELKSTVGRSNRIS